jgi:hypothetical protein
MTSHNILLCRPNLVMTVSQSLNQFGKVFYEAVSKVHTNVHFYAKIQGSVQENIYI